MRKFIVLIALCFCSAVPAQAAVSPVGGGLPPSPTAPTESPDGGQAAQNGPSAVRIDPATVKPDAPRIGSAVLQPTAERIDPATLQTTGEMSSCKCAWPS